MRVLRFLRWLFRWLPDAWDHIPASVKAGMVTALVSVIGWLEQLPIAAIATLAIVTGFFSMIGLVLFEEARANIQRFRQRSRARNEGSVSFETFLEDDTVGDLTWSTQQLS